MTVPSVPEVLGPELLGVAPAGALFLRAESNVGMCDVDARQEENTSGTEHTVFSDAALTVVERCCARFAQLRLRDATVRSEKRGRYHAAITWFDEYPICRDGGSYVSEGGIREARSIDEERGSSGENQRPGERAE